MPAFSVQPALTPFIQDGARAILSMLWVEENFPGKLGDDVWSEVFSLSGLSIATPHPAPCLEFYLLGGIPEE